MYVNSHPDEAVFVERVKQYTATNVWPNSLAWDQAQAFPEGIWRELAAFGLVGFLLPKDQGGKGFSTVGYSHVVRELSKGDPALGMNVAAINALAIGHLHAYGTQEQKATYLPRILSGEISMAWGLTEPEAGSDAKMTATKGIPIEGRPGWFHLTGGKMFITNGVRADLAVILGRREDDSMTAFLVETHQAGYTVERRIETVGVRASNTGLLKFSGAGAWHTPCNFEEAISLLYRGRIGIAAMAVGIAEKAIELAVEYSKGRSQFKRRLADMQSVQNMVADSATEVRAARLMTEDAAARCDQGLPYVLESSMAKLFASEVANRVTNRAIQIHGGRGMMPEYMVEKLWRDAKLTEIGEGASEIQRLVIAKQVLK